MTREIVIQGNMVQERETSILRTVALDNFLSRIERKTPMHLPQLPKPSAFHWGTPTGQRQNLLLLVESDPQVIDLDLDRTAVYRLSIPYSRFFFSLNSTDVNTNDQWYMNDYQLFWAKTPYAEPDRQDMQAAMLPNIYGDGRICFGNTAPEADMSLAARINTIINAFYLTRFNHDLNIRYPNGWRGYTSWVRMTENDPTAWTEWSDWTATGRTRVSWNDLVQNINGSIVNRLDPVIAADPIPDIPMGATWGRTNEWLDTLTPTQRARLRDTLAARDGVTDATAE